MEVMGRKEKEGIVLSENKEHQGTIYLELELKLKVCLRKGMSNYWIEYQRRKGERKTLHLSYIFLRACSGQCSHFKTQPNSHCLKMRRKLKKRKDIFFYTLISDSQVGCPKYFRYSQCDFISNDNSVCGIRKLIIHRLIPPGPVKCSYTLNRL